MWHLIGSTEKDTDQKLIVFDNTWAGPSGNKAVLGSGPNVVRIACLSDTHSNVKGLKVPEADVLIYAGDAIHHKHSEPEFLRFCEWINRIPCETKFLVAGNHDFFLRDNKDRLKDLMPGVVVLEDSGAEIGDTGLSVYGAPWTVARNIFYLADAYEIPESAVREKWAQIPTGVDVLVTHSPPWDILDLTYKSRHVGSKYLRNEVAGRVYPKIHIFGHNHDAPGMQLGVFENGARCLFVNAAITFSRKPYLIEYHY